MPNSYSLHAWGLSNPTPQWIKYINQSNLEGRVYYILEEGAGYIIKNEKHYFRKNHLYVLPHICNIQFFLENDNFLHLYIDFLNMGVMNYDSVISFDIETQPLIKADINEFLCFMKAKGLTAANKSVLSEAFYSNKERVSMIIDSLFYDIREAFPYTITISPTVTKVIRYIQKNFFNDITVTEISHEMNISKSHLLRTFKNSTGITLYQYIKKYRFDIALNMLAAGASVSEAAEKCGFLSVSAFSNSFKKEYGYPPTKMK